jgi:hypothetical protein
MERPLSAPGSVELAATTTVETNTESSETRKIFAEIEERANNVMNGDNRGHKLSFDELLPKGRLFEQQSKEMIPSEEDFEKVEREFSEYQHYLRDITTSGLNHTEVRLLYSYWSRFGKVDSLRRALYIPERLHDAESITSIRGELAGLSIHVISESLIRMIEEQHKEHLLILRFVDKLNSMLAALDEEDDEEGEDDKDGKGSKGDRGGKGGKVPRSVNDPDWVPRVEDRNQIMAVLAIANQLVNATEKWEREIGEARFKLTRAIEYGHLIGRFLLKRLRTRARRTIE